MLDGEFDQKKVVDHGKGEHRGIEEGNEKQPRRAERSRKAHNFLFPGAELEGQEVLRKVEISLTEPYRASEQGLDRFGDDVVNAMKLVGRNNVWREDIDDVAQRPEQDVPFEEKIVELGAKPGEIPRVLNAQFERAQSPKMARVADLVEVAQLREALHVNFGDASNPVENR